MAAIVARGAARRPVPRRSSEDSRRSPESAFRRTQRTPYSRRMNALRLFALLIYTFGAFAYGAMLAALGRASSATCGWGGRSQPPSRRGREVGPVNGALLVLSFLWFCCNAGALLYELVTSHGRPGSSTSRPLFLAFAFPPIIMHVSWVEIVAADANARSRRGWRLALWPAYVGGARDSGLALVLLIERARAAVMTCSPNQLLGFGLTAHVHRRRRVLHRAHATHGDARRAARAASRADRCSGCSR